MCLGLSYQMLKWDVKIHVWNKEDVSLLANVLSSVCVCVCVSPEADRRPTQLAELDTVTQDLIQLNRFFSAL